MKVIDKTDGGFIVHVNSQEMEVLLGKNIGTYCGVHPDELIGKAVAIRNLDNAIKNIDSIFYTKKKILEGLEELYKHVELVTFPIIDREENK